MEELEGVDFDLRAKDQIGDVLDKGHVMSACNWSTCIV